MSFTIKKTSYSNNLLVEYSTLPLFNASSIAGENINITNIKTNDIFLYNGIEWINSGYIYSTGPTGYNGSNAIEYTGTAGLTGYTL